MNCRHNWQTWTPCIAYPGGVEVKADPCGDFTPPKEFGRAEPAYNYRRECNLMGCTARQYTRDLVPVGDVDLFE